MNAQAEAENEAANFSPWCPKCRWYKGLREPQCPHCGFDERAGKTVPIGAEKRAKAEGAVKKEVFRKSGSLLIIFILIGAGAAYMGLQMMQEKAPAAKTADILEQTGVAVTTTPTPREIVNNSDAVVPASTTPAPEETAPEVSVSGRWTIESGNLSSFADLHFIGDADFNPDGTYTINTHPREFDRSEGLIVYTGRYTVEGLEMQGGGKSTIYQRGAVFGTSATDTLTAQIDPSGESIVGVVESTSGFHGGEGGGTATLDFVLVREGS